MPKSQTELSKMTYQEFDDYMRSDDRGTPEEAAIATINYLSGAEHPPTGFQKCLLCWHAGQDYAKSGQNELAVRYFNRASESEKEMTEIFGPAATPYHKATIAFLEKDRDSIGQQLQAVMSIPIKDYPLTNVVLIPGRIHDMYENLDKSYDAIFKMAPSLPPLSGQHDWHQIKAIAAEEGAVVGAYVDKLKKDQLTNGVRPEWTSSSLGGNNVVAVNKDVSDDQRQTPPSLH